MGIVIFANLTWAQRLLQASLSGAIQDGLASWENIEDAKQHVSELVKSSFEFRFKHFSTGWWFGTYGLFSIYWECHHPS